MKKAPIKALEAQRLAALQSYRILDTMPEASFDDITALASIICETPIALVSLVDGQRQWFKSRVGLDAEETPRDISFCGHAIETSAIFEVSNALTDERFSDNPLVVGAPNIRFYAGMPLVTPDGFGIGTLCVIDRRPRELTEEQRTALQVLGRQVVAQLELRKSNTKLRDLVHEMDRANQEIRQRGAQLVEQSRLASLGKMAGGIAHEINNLLAIITGLTAQIGKTLAAAPTPNDVVIQSVKRVEDVAFRISKITKGLLSLAGAGVEEGLSLTKLSGLFASAKALLEVSFRNSGITLEVPSDEVEFECRKGHVLEIIFHLLRNSIEAIGELPNSDDSTGRRVWVQLRKESEAFQLDFCDNGPGVASAILPHLMEPFVTTKDPGNGTGLALSVARTEARSHGGDLTYQRLNGVTIFTLQMPYKQGADAKNERAA